MSIYKHSPVPVGDSDSSSEEHWCENICFLAVSVRAEGWQSRMYPAIF